MSTGTLAAVFVSPQAVIAALVSFGEAPPLLGVDACDPQPVTSSSIVATAMPHAGAVNRSLAGIQGRRTNMASPFCDPSSCPLSRLVPKPTPRIVRRTSEPNR
jgi:hypothetical protein